MQVKTHHETEGIVLKTYNYGEYDRIVRFFSLKYGKLAGIAKGARNSRRRFPGTLEPWCLSRIFFTQTTPDRLVFLERCEPIEYFSELRTDPLKIAYVAKIGEMVEAFSPDRKKNEGLYSTFLNFLSLMEKERPRESLLIAFELKVLAQVGYAPLLEKCVVCHQPISEGASFFFVAERGGVKCAGCTSVQDQFPIKMSPGTLKSLNFALASPPDKVTRLHLSAGAQRESRLMVDNFLHHLLGRTMKTTKVIDQLEHHS